MYPLYPKRQIIISKVYLSYSSLVISAWLIRLWLFWQLFNRLREERPQDLDKIVPICGDITLPELGISMADQQLLAETVSVVFHSAATVKFDEALKLSVTINMLGTKRLVHLCHTMVNLEVSLGINV